MRKGGWALEAATVFCAPERVGVAKPEPVIRSWVAYDDAAITDPPGHGALYVYSGDRLAYSSRWSGNLNVEQDFPVWTDATGSHQLQLQLQCVQRHQESEGGSVDSGSIVDRYPELNLTVTFTRAQLNDILAPMMNQLAELVYKVVERARLPMSGIDLVVRTGRSSKIVAVRELLEGLFSGKVTEHDPFTSVAAGLAISDYRGYRWE
jgi:hypothetical protein